LALPRGRAISGPIARIGGGTVDASFWQDERTLATIDAALDLIADRAVTRAA
jgi:hypothetical protein